MGVRCDVDEIEKVRAELKSLEEEVKQLDLTVVRLEKELDEAKKRRDKLKPVWSPDFGLIGNLRSRLARLEREAECARIWATAQIVKIEGRPDDRLVKLTPKQVHVMISESGVKLAYDRTTGTTRWKTAGRITNLEELTK